MSTFWTGKIIDAIGEATKRATGTNHADRAARAVYQTTSQLQRHGRDRATLAAEFLRDGGLIHQATGAATASRETARTAVRAAAQASFVKQIATICGKAGAAGAVVDGAVGGLQAAKHLQQGTIDGTQAIKHVGAEAGCGFVTSASGTAGTLAVFMVTGSMGPAALAAGMGASMGSRYLYRKVIPETLPNDEELREQVKKESARKAREAAEQSKTEQSDASPGASSNPSPAGPADTTSTPSDRKDYGDGPDLEDIGPDRDDDDEARADDSGDSDDSKNSTDEPTGRRQRDERDDSDNSDNKQKDDDGDFFEDIGPAE